MASTFDWELVVQQDENLKRLDTFVQMIIDKLPTPSVSVRADAGRGGSKFEAPVVKSESAATATEDTAMESPGPSMAVPSGSDSDTPQFIDYRQYEGGFSSEVDTREVDPMEELSDFEVGPPPSQPSQQPSQEETPLIQQQQLEEPPVDEEMDNGNDMDLVEEPTQEIEQEAAQASSMEEEDDKLCEVCKGAENGSQTVLCDGCEAAYHVYCLVPPLPSVPEEENWYCPICTAKHAEADALRVKEESAQTASANGNAGEHTALQGTGPVSNEIPAGSEPNGSAPNESVTSNGSNDINELTAIPIDQALAEDPEKTNSLLVHACNCDALKCQDPEFHVFCPHMKRLLRSVCWASHNPQWRSYGIARITAEMLAFHALLCDLEHCNVPLCEDLRREEIV